MWPIQTQDKLFHDGNGTTELGTVVTAEWLNDVQQALLMVLAAGGQTPAKGNHNLLRDAIQRIVNNHTPAASATVAGVVKLNDTLSSQSTTEALTAAQGKVLADALGALGDEAFKQRGALGSRNLDTLKGITNFGVWFMSANAGATTALNYPAARAGTLLVLPSAYEGIQLYIPFEWAQIYIRNTTQSGAWSDWRIIGEVVN
ncbi:MAG: hypothetical protein KBG52_00190, partial [Neisseria sp.]|nr:hypothetical protein [Neisseria sp.]